MVYRAKAILFCEDFGKIAQVVAFIEANDPDDAIADVEAKVRADLPNGLKAFNSECGTKVKPEQVSIKFLKLREVPTNDS